MNSNNSLESYRLPLSRQSEPQRDVLREKMKRVYWYSFWSIALFHLLGTVGSMLKTFSMGMSRFDSGEPITFLEKVLMAVWKSLIFPIGTLSQRLDWGHLPGILGWIPIMLNSMLWAGAIIGIIVIIRKHQKSQNKTSEHIPEGRERPSENAQR